MALNVVGYVPKFIGTPDGPAVFVPELGEEVGTFTERHGELDSHLFAQKPCLMYHVPKKKRGPFKPNELANFDPSRGYRVDAEGWTLCEGKTGKRSVAEKPIGSPCNKFAINRAVFCAAHGGKLHPWDKVAPKDPADFKIEKTNPNGNNRWSMLKAGILNVDDLDDEELIRGMTRNNKGEFARGAPRAAIPRPMYDKLVTRIHERAFEKFRTSLLAAVDTLSEIADPANDAFEATDKIKAANIIIERVLGKTPDKVDVSLGVKPYEEVLQGIATLSREESRARRAQAAIEPPAPVVDVCDTCGVTALTSDGICAVCDPVVDECPRCGEHKPQEEALCQSCAQTHESSAIGLHAVRSETTVPPSELAPQTDPSTSGEPAPDTASRLSPGVYTPEEARPRAIEAEDKAQRKADYLARIKAARDKRYGARAMGRKTVSDMPFARVVSYDDDGGIRLQWHEVKMTAPKRNRRNDFED